MALPKIDQTDSTLGNIWYNLKVRKSHKQITCLHIFQKTNKNFNSTALEARAELREDLIRFLEEDWLLIFSDVYENRKKLFDERICENLSANF